MTPMLFGPASRQLFGLFHAPERDARLAVVICMPLGQEAVRGHRLFRVLADRLARAGVAVLRFDYHGSGDSPGEDTDGDLEGWRRDVCTAHEELRRRTGARRIGWAAATSSTSLRSRLTSKPGPRRSTSWDRWLARLKRAISASKARRKQSAPVSGILAGSDPGRDTALGGRLGSRHPHSEPQASEVHWTRRSGAARTTARIAGTHSATRESIAPWASGATVSRSPR